MSGDAVRRPRGRPPKHLGAVVTREAILDASLRRLATSGYGGLSLRGVARDLGVTLGTIQHHFRTKAHLWRATVDRAIDAARPSDLVGVGPGDQVESWFERIRVLVERSTSTPGVTAALFVDLGEGAEERLAYVTGRLQGTLDAARAAMADAVAADRLRPVLPEALLGLLSLGITSLAGSPAAAAALLGVELGDDAERARLADGIADLLLFGLAPR